MIALNGRSIANIIAALIVAFFVSQFAMIYGKPNGWLYDDKGRAIGKDFLNFYAAGKLVAEGKPAAPYDWDEHKRAHREVIGQHNTDFYPWPYPPPFLAVAQALVLLPFTASFAAFMVVTFAAFAYAAVRITGERSAVLWAAASAATFCNIYAGQNGMMAAALLGLGLVYLPSRPLLAGVLFGLLAFKPHLGLLIPLALAAGGYWRTFLAAAMTVLLTAALSVLAYGVEPWAGFVAQMGRIGGVALVEAYQGAFKFQSVFGLARKFGAAPSVAMAAHIALAIAAAIAIALVWRSKISFDLKCAALAVGALLMSPYVFIYDLAVLAIGQAFVIRSMLRANLDETTLRETAIALVLINVLIFVFAFLRLPTGLFATLALGAVVARLHLLQPASRATSVRNWAAA